MNIVVCVKQVPDSSEVKIDPVKGTLIRDGVPSILNPDDANALEEALRIKDKLEDVRVIVITMGPVQASVMLRECLAMGADEAILLSDRAFAGADTWATSNTLEAALRKIPDTDMVFVGRQAIDGDTAQVGPQIAERLGIPQVTYVQKVDVEDGSCIVERQLEDGYEAVRVKTPVLLSAVKELNTPRYMSIKGICEAYEKEIVSWSLKDIGLRPDEVGLKSSPTKVFRSFSPEIKEKGVFIEGEPEAVVRELACILKKEQAI